MPVKVGKSYVSEAAYNYASSQVSENTDSGQMLKALADKFPNLKIGVGTAPFSGQGTGNVQIAPNILRQMAKDPDKRLEYEALLYDINEASNQAGSLFTGGRRLKAHGFVITGEGGLRCWTISEADDGHHRQQTALKRKNKKSWLDNLLPKIPSKKKAKGVL